MIRPSIPQAVLLVALGITFVHFVYAGARTLARSNNDDRAAALAQFSFFATGIGMTWFTGLHVPIKLYNGIAAAILLLCSLALYEWARQVIVGRRFYAAWSGHTPEAVCDEGPYAYIRHPIYLSYMMAFLAVLVAMPALTTLAVFAFNVALFAHAAITDERSLADSAIATDYARYKARTGMFFPRISQSTHS